MSDIWGRTITLGSTIAGERVRVSFGATNTGLIAMRAQIGASRRQVGQLLDLSTGNLHIFAGIPEPCQVQLMGVVASSSHLKTFLETFGNACSNQSLQITVTPGYCATTRDQSLVYNIEKAILTDFAGAVETNQYMFVSTVNLIGLGPTITVS